jgi:hypothetical protein
VECILIAAMLGAMQTACAFGHSDPCPWNPTARVSSINHDPFTWELPRDEDPVFTVRMTRLPGPTGIKHVTLLPVDDGWVFDYGDGVPWAYFGTPPEPCSGEFGWQMSFGLPGRAESEPVRLPAALDYAEPEVVCPWDDEDNCLEVGIYL